MAHTRRKKYSNVVKYNERAGEGAGKGDVGYKVFNCLNVNCSSFIQIETSSIIKGFSIDCPLCGHTHESGKYSHYYDYDLVNIKSDTIYESGEFLVSHDEHVSSGSCYKYCIVCHALKPYSSFHKHGARRGTGRQGECKTCKKIYNGFKNKTRIPEQHREASRQREFYNILSSDGAEKLDNENLIKVYDGRCLSCSEDLPKDFHWDHILPAKYLWPLNQKNAMPLCKKCNGKKSARWPSEFYSEDQLKIIAAKSSTSWKLLSSKKPRYNPTALNLLRNPDHVSNLLEKYSHRYKDEILKLNIRVLADEGFNFLKIAVDAKKITPDWLEQINLA